MPLCITKNHLEYQTLGNIALIYPLTFLHLSSMNSWVYIHRKIRTKKQKIVKWGASMHTIPLLHLKN